MGHPSSVGRIWSPAQLRCHSNSSLLLQHLLSPTSFHASADQPPVVTLSPSSPSPSPSLCASDGPLSAPVYQRGNPFLWRNPSVGNEVELLPPPSRDLLVRSDSRLCRGGRAGTLAVAVAGVGVRLSSELEGEESAGEGGAEPSRETAQQQPSSCRPRLL
ncbi:unnamed protein product [Menidia menidia]|uniref:(Atlantic silverside) hypothetical protein n=1 Tax=Menidia menidia TaxID=238744 RepID=A0A8S4A9P8_9TELE|nr:unnamed protein product [Menidia menidia]